MRFGLLFKSFQIFGSDDASAFGDGACEEVTEGSLFWLYVAADISRTAVEWITSRIDLHVVDIFQIDLGDDV